jgi:hypothetical protein
VLVTGQLKDLVVRFAMSDDDLTRHLRSVRAYGFSQEALRLLDRMLDLGIKVCAVWPVELGQGIVDHV